MPTIVPKVPGLVLVTSPKLWSIAFEDPWFKFYSMPLFFNILNWEIYSKISTDIEFLVIDLKI